MSEFPALETTEGLVARLESRETTEGLVARVRK